jgi:D-alanyl-lipoteichoic acid acyltransferase DltB (MBOAT superfamily)
MPFNSLHYLLFLPLVLFFFRAAGERFRWAVLLAGSLVFYAALQAPALLAALLLVAAASYWTGLRLVEARSIGSGQKWLWSGIGANLAVLFSLRFLPLFLPGAKGPWLAIGVSYFVFQAISYLADIYLEIAKPERHFGRFLLFLAFFPKLLQGPIERAGDLLPQLHQPYVFDYATARSGLRLFGWGLFQKVVIADRLAAFVDPVYADLPAHSGLPLVLATYFYAFQIYFDFSGYTDMALGTARLFNLRLTPNFNHPYLATSIADFWRRWHISFSRWILDYIFRPLQMLWRNAGTAGAAAALLVTFLASGLWHGASGGFLAWGGLHGLYMGASLFYRPWQKRLHNAFGVKKGIWLTVWQRIVTFHLVAFAWIFFRAPDLDQANYVVRHLFSDLPGQLLSLGSKERLNQLLYLGQGSHAFIVALVAVAAGMALPLLQDRANLDQRPLVLRWSCYYLFLALLIYFGVFEDQNRFIYFQF